jgi:drug/metabolite transporter (DMT)-like permease
MIFTLLVLLAFAANSLLCRWALGVWSFDPVAFTLVRIWSGALMLSLLMAWRTGSAMPVVSIRTPRFWALGLCLLVYAGCFSTAYVELDAGVGAFILFACVQLVLQAAAIKRSGHPGYLKIIGVLVSLFGLGLLLLPGAHAPESGAVLWMVLAAVGWASFVILGQGSVSPLQDVHSAFVAAGILVIPALALVSLPVTMSWQPWALAVVSGAIASGVGYFGWYQILPRLGLHKAAQLQLLVPVITVLMGWLVLSEPQGILQFVAMIIIITGVYLSVAVRRNP